LPFGLVVGVAAVGVPVDGTSCEATFGTAGKGKDEGGALETIRLKSFPFLPGDSLLTTVVAAVGGSGADADGAATGGGADIREKSLPLPLPPEETVGLGAAPPPDGGPEVVELDMAMRICYLIGWRVESGQYGRSEDGGSNNKFIDFDGDLRGLEKNDVDKS
jgi:hypothetical protein